MKKWIVTADARRGIGELRRRMVKRGATVVHGDPVPLGVDEQAVRAEGPDDLPDRLRDDPMIHEVYPDSEVVLHGDSFDGAFSLEPGFAITTNLGTIDPALAGGEAATRQPGPTPTNAGATAGVGKRRRKASGP